MIEDGTYCNKHLDYGDGAFNWPRPFKLNALSPKLRPIVIPALVARLSGLACGELEGYLIAGEYWDYGDSAFNKLH